MGRQERLSPMRSALESTTKSLRLGQGRELLIALGKKPRLRGREPIALGKKPRLMRQGQSGGLVGFLLLSGY